MDFARMKIYHLNMSSGIMRLRALSELVKKKGDDFMNNWDELYFHGLIPTFDSYHRHATCDRADGTIQCPEKMLCWIL